MSLKKVGTGIVEFVRAVGCDGTGCATIPINNGLPLTCKTFDDMESALLRRRALEDEQLFASGFTRIVDRSALHGNLGIRNSGINVGEIRTEADGARGVAECKYNYEGMSIDMWEKRFYVVNTNKHLKLCPRDFVGKQLSDLIGDRMTDFDNFAETDLADILIGAIIEEYNKRFVAKFLLLAVYENEGANMHGDDGVLAKAYYAWREQYFSTVSFDLSSIAAGKKLVAIQGGKQYSKTVTEFGGNTDLLLLDFVQWLNNLKQGNALMYAASLDLANELVTVVSRFAVTKVSLRVAIVDALETVDWGSQTCWGEQAVTTTILQNAMPINDVPLLFNFEEIDESNFVSAFKLYLKEFQRYLHRNGFADINMSDIRIGIDPELMLERDDAVVGQYLAGGIAINFMDQIGLAADRFVPINALSGTGLFFMTVPQNILVLSDASNAGNGLPGTGMVKIEPECEGQFGVIFDNPIGSAVEAFGAFASNILGSWFVVDNNLENRAPYENTRLTLACFSPECTKGQIGGPCSIDVAGVDAVATYNGGDDETTITVTVTVANPLDMPTVTYELNWSLSDGTAGSASGAAFDITLPGNQTASGLILNVNGTVTAMDIEGMAIPNALCNAPVNFSTQFGTEGSDFCTYSKAVTDTNGVLDTVKVLYTIAGQEEEVAFVDATLDLLNSGDAADIEDEIEAILPGSTVSISMSGDIFTLIIGNVPAYITDVKIKYTNDEPSTKTVVLDADCGED